MIGNIPNRFPHNRLDLLAYLRQVWEIFRWLRGVALPGDVLIIEFPLLGEKLSLRLPLASVKRRNNSQQRGGAFLVRRVVQPKDLIPPAGWVTIFSDPDAAAFERPRAASEIAPLRWGLNQSEKALALRIARENLARSLSSAAEVHRSQPLPPRFSLAASVDVALWVNGKLRGSRIVGGAPLGQAIAEAALRASRDSRFKPLELDELPQARIQITLFHPFRMPLSGTMLSRDLYPEKGYYLAAPGGQSGFFLPEVFNTRKFSGPAEFFKALAEQKAGLPKGETHRAVISVFEVDDFVEPDDGQDPITLWGPMPRPEPYTKQEDLKLMTRCRAAADWLLRIQEADGYLPPLIDPFAEGHSRTIHWGRLAFTAWSLAEFGASINNVRYQEAAKNSFGYLKRHLLGAEPLPLEVIVALPYFAQLGFSLHDDVSAMESAHRLLPPIRRDDASVMLLSHAANVFRRFAKDDPVFANALRYTLEELRERWMQQMRHGAAVNLAEWAEAAHTFAGVNQEFANSITAFLKSHQLPNGAFPATTATSFAYTRGTAKIFEVLALEPSLHAHSIRRALQWIFSMQYDTRSNFFVPSALQPRVLGGFRHDYLNAECWIDAAGHVLLGSARLLKQTDGNWYVDNSLPLNGGISYNL